MPAVYHSLLQQLGCSRNVALWAAANGANNKGVYSAAEVVDLSCMYHTGLNSVGASAQPPQQHQMLQLHAMLVQTPLQSAADLPSGHSAHQISVKMLCSGATVVLSYFRAQLAAVQ
jgi:hypothetical protein